MACIKRMVDKTGYIKTSKNLKIGLSDNAEVKIWKIFELNW